MVGLDFCLSCNSAMMQPNRLLSLSMSNRFNVIERVSIVSGFINGLLALYKMVVGWFGLSPALFADGVHSLSDLLGDGLVYFAGRLAHQDPDHDHPYGHWRYETFATIGLGILLIGTGLGIAYDSVLRFIHGNYLLPTHLTLVAAVLSILANEWLFRYTLKAARLIKSDMLEANAYHSRADALTSVIVLVGLLGTLAGFEFMDAIAALVVAVFVVRIGFKWSWRALHELSEAGVDNDTKAQIMDTILAQPGVKYCHMLRTRQLAGKVFLDVHVNIDWHASASEGHYIGECVSHALAKRFDDIEDITVHIDTVDHPEVIPDSLQPSRQELMAQLMPVWQQQLQESDIARITLHYLKPEIEMEVWLHAGVLKQQPLTHWQAVIAEPAEALGVLSKVTVMVG